MATSTPPRGSFSLGKQLLADLPPEHAIQIDPATLPHGPVARVNPHSDTFNRAIEADADPEAAMRRRMWEQMARRHALGELGNELGAGAGSSQSASRKTPSRQDNSAVMASSSKTHSGATLKYPRVAKLKLVPTPDSFPYALNSIRDANDYHLFEDLENDIGVIIIDGDLTRLSTTHEIVVAYYKLSAVRGEKNLSNISKVASQVTFYRQGEELLTRSSPDFASLTLPNQLSSADGMRVKLKRPIAQHNLIYSQVYQKLDGLVFPGDEYETPDTFQRLDKSPLGSQAFVVGIDTNSREIVEFDLQSGDVPANARFRANETGATFASHLLMDSESPVTQTSASTEKWKVPGWALNGHVFSFKTANYRISLFTDGRTHWVLTKTLKTTAATQVAKPAVTYPRTIKLQRIEVPPTELEKKHGFPGTVLFESADTSIRISIAAQKRDDGTNSIIIYKEGALSTNFHRLKADKWTSSGTINRQGTEWTASQPNECVTTINAINGTLENAHEIEIVMQRSLSDRDINNGYWFVPKMVAETFPGEIYSGDPELLRYLNNMVPPAGKNLMDLTLGENEKLSFVTELIRNRDGEVTSFTPPKNIFLSVKNSLSGEWEKVGSPLSAKVISNPKRTANLYVMSVKTDEYRIVVATNGKNHYILYHKLDHTAMAAKAAEAATGQGSQGGTGSSTQEHIVLTSQKKNDPIMRIDNLTIDRNRMNQRQNIATKPITLGVDFRSKDWNAFKKAAQGKDGKKITLYFGPEGSACPYSATLDASGKKITLKPTSHTDILPELVIELEGASSGNLRALNGDRLRLIEQLAQGPEMKAKAQKLSGISTAEIEFVGDWTGQFRNTHKEIPDIEGYSLEIVDGNIPSTFSVKVQLSDDKPMSPAFDIKQKIETLYTNYRATAAAAASLILPEVKPAADIDALAQVTYPLTTTLERITLPNDFFASSIGEEGKDLAIENIGVYTDEALDIGIFVPQRSVERMDIKSVIYFRPSDVKKLTYSNIRRVSTPIAMVKNGDHFEPPISPRRNWVSSVKINEIGEIIISLDRDPTDDDLIDKMIFDNIEALTFPGDEYKGEPAVNMLAVARSDLNFFSIGNGAETVAFDTNFISGTVSNMRYIAGFGNKASDFVSAIAAKNGTTYPHRFTPDQSMTGLEPFSGTIVAFRTAKHRVTVFSTNYINYVVTHELDHAAMATKAAEPTTGQGSQSGTGSGTQEPKVATSHHKNDPITRIDNLTIDRNRMNQRQNIATKPITLSVDFKSKNWNAFKKAAQDKDSKEITLYFGPEGSACTYTAELSANAKKITLKPINHKDILPELMIELEGTSGGNLRALNGGRLPLFEQLAQGPEIQVRLEEKQKPEFNNLQLNMTGDWTGTFRKYFQDDATPHSEDFRFEFTDDKNPANFKLTLYALEATTTEMAVAHRHRLQKFIVDYRGTAAAKASLILPEVQTTTATATVTKPAITYPHTFNLTRIMAPDDFFTAESDPYYSKPTKGVSIFEDRENDIGIYLTGQGDRTHVRYYRPSEISRLCHAQIMRVCGSTDLEGTPSKLRPKFKDSCIDKIRIQGTPATTVEFTLKRAITDDDLVYKALFKQLENYSREHPIKEEEYEDPFEVFGLKRHTDPYQSFALGDEATRELIGFNVTEKNAPDQIRFARIKEKEDGGFDILDDPSQNTTDIQAVTVKNNNGKMVPGHIISLKSNYRRVLILTFDDTHYVVAKKLKAPAEDQKDPAKTDQPGGGNPPPPDKTPPADEGKGTPPPPPKFKIPLSAADKRLLGDVMSPAWAVAAASDVSVNIESTPIQIAAGEYLHFAPGENLVASPNQLRWLQKNTRVDEDGNKYLDLVPFRELYWYELRSVSGKVTLRLPLRYSPTAGFPFVPDETTPPEVFISDAQAGTTQKITDDRFRVKRKNGKLVVFMLDGSFDGERIKDFHFETVTSKDCPAVLGGVQVLDSSGERMDESLLKAELTDNIDRTVVAVFGHDESDVPKVIYTKPVATRQSERDVRLTYFSTIVNGRTELIQAHIDGLSYDGETLGTDTQKLKLTFDAPEAKGAPHLEEIAVTIEKTNIPDVFTLTEEGGAGRIYLWNKAVHAIWEPSDFDLKTYDGTNAAAVLTASGMPGPIVGNSGAYKKRPRTPDLDALVHVDTGLAPSRLSALPSHHVFTQDPSSHTIDSAILEAHDKIFKPEPETIHTLLINGRYTEMATFAAPDGSMILLPIEIDPNNSRWYRVKKQHKDAATFGAKMILANPDKPGEFVLVPAKVFGDGNQIHVVRETNAVLDLEIASTKTNANKRRLWGILAKLPRVKTQNTKADVRAALYETEEFFGFDKDAHQENLADNEFFELGKDIELKDGRTLTLRVFKNPDNGRLSFSGYDKDDDGIGAIEVMDREENIKVLPLVRAQNGGALLYIKDGDDILTLEIDDNGQPIILKLPQGIDQFYQPKPSPKHIMITEDGSAYQSNAKSPATRRELTAPGVWPRVIEIATDLARQSGGGGAQLSMDKDGSAARVKVQMSIDEDGTRRITSARIKTEGTEQGWHNADFDELPYDSENKSIQIFVRAKDPVINKGREYYDYAMLDFASEENITGENFGLRAAHYNRNHNQLNAMPKDARFTDPKYRNYRDAMLWSAFIYFDTNGPSIVEQMKRLLARSKVSDEDNISADDLADLYLSEHPKAPAPAVRRAALWAVKPPVVRQRRKKDETATPTAPAADAAAEENPTP